MNDIYDGNFLFIDNKLINEKIKINKIKGSQNEKKRLSYFLKAFYLFGTPQNSCNGISKVTLYQMEF